MKIRKNKLQNFRLRLAARISKLWRKRKKRSKKSLSKMYKLMIHSKTRAIAKHQDRKKLKLKNSKKKIMKNMAGTIQ